jgi:hypothetical protein
VAGGGEAGAEVVDGIGGAEREGDPCRAGRAPARRALDGGGGLDHLDAAEVEECRPPAAAWIVVERRPLGAELAGVEVAHAPELKLALNKPTLTKGHTAILDRSHPRHQAVAPLDATLTAAAQATTRRCR